MNLLASTHIRPSGRSESPSGHAQDMRGDLEFISGDGKHKCEQWPLTAVQKFSPSGCL